MADTTIIGKVGVRVYPETSHFRAHLRKKLNDEEKRSELEVPVELDLKDIRAQMRKLLAELKTKASKPIDVNVGFNENDAARDAKKLHEKFDDILGKVNVDLEVDLGDEVEDDVKRVTKSFEKLQREVSNIRFDDEFKKFVGLGVDPLIADIDKLSDKLGELENTELRLSIEGMTRAEREVDKLQTKLGDLRARLTPELAEDERRKVLHQIEDLKDQIEGELDNINASVQPTLMGAAMKYVGERLSFLARPRTVMFIPAVSQAAASKVAATLAAVSGARLGGQIFTDLTKMVKTLDKDLPKLAGLSTAISGISGWALAAASNLFALSASLAQIAPAALVLPGIFTGIGISVGAVIIAMKDFKKVFPGFEKSWKGLKKTVSGNFWKEAEDGVRQFGVSALPELTKGVDAASTALGRFFGHLSNGLRVELLGGPMLQMFNDLAKSILITTNHTGSMARIIRILGQQGAGTLPRLATWFGKITDKFARFLTVAQEDGSLQEWIDRGILRMRELGKVIYQSGRLFGALATAAEKAGGSTLNSFGDAMERAANAASSHGFQNRLVAVLTAADKMMRNISEQSGPAFTNYFKTAGETLTVILPQLGRTIGSALDGILNALSRKKFTDGVKYFFDGIAVAVENLKPALGPMADAGGALLELAGKLLKAFTPNLEKMLTTGAEAIQKLAPAFADLATSLSPQIGEILDKVSVPLGKITDAIASKGLPKLGEMFSGFLDKVTPGAIDFLEKVSAFIDKKMDEATPERIKKAADALAKIAGLVFNVSGGVLDFFDWLTETQVDGNTILDDLGNIAGGLNKFADGVQEFFSKINRAMNENENDGNGSLWTRFKKSITTGAPTFETFMVLFAPLPTAITSAMGARFNEIKWSDIGNVLLGSMTSGLFSTEGLTAFGKTIVDLIISTLTTGMLDSDGLTGVGESIIDSLVAGFGKAVHKVQEWLEKLTGDIPIWKGDAKRDAGLLTPAGESIIMSLILGFANRRDAVITWLGNLTRDIKGQFTSAPTALNPTGSNLIQGLITGMAGKLASVKTTALKNLTEAKASLSGAATTLTSRGSELINGFTKAMAEKYASVRTAASKLKTEATSGLGAVGSTLSSAGRSLIDGFISGIRSAFSTVRSTLSELTGMLPEWKGPLPLDKRILTPAGEAVMGSFITGLESRYGDVKKSLTSLSQEIEKTTIAAPQIGEVDTHLQKASRSIAAKVLVDPAGNPAGADAGPGITFNINEHNPVAEPTSVTVTKALRMAHGMGMGRRR